MPKAAEVNIDPGPIVVLSPDVNLSKTKSEPNKQLTFPVEPHEPIRVADGKKKEVLYVIQAYNSYYCNPVSRHVYFST